MSIDPDPTRSQPGNWALVALCWFLVSLPLAWGVLMTLRKAALLFWPRV